MTGIEPLSEFRVRVRAFVGANLEPADPDNPKQLEEPAARTLQATIFDAGFAGIAIPTEYGGAGLTLEHQKVWAEEVDNYVVPAALYVSIGMLGVALLDHGSETLKRRHIARILRGDERWIQLLSEPSSGSDMAAVMTRATRDGETWTISGSKTWSSRAGAADYGMCLARTNWDAPKHKGLSMFVVPLRHPGVTIEPIIGIEGGPAHFFQEYLDDVSLPADHLIGDENDGWSVAHSLLFHERNATAGVGHGLGLGGGQGDGGGDGHGVEDLVRYATTARTIDDPAVRQLIAEAYIAQQARAHANDRVGTGMRTGAFKGDWGSLLKLGLALDTLRRGEIALAVAGADGVIWNDDTLPVPPAAGGRWLGARAISIAGGTNEMQRNIIAERLLGMPREPTTDRDLPFRDVAARRRS